MNDSNCLTRDYIKREIFPIIHKELNDFLDHEKINKEGNELILPLKEKIDKESLQTKSVELRKILKNFIEQNTEIQNIVKKNFAKRLGLSENEIDISPWVPMVPRINVPLDHIPNSKKKIAGALGWHQDTGSWYNLDLKKNIKNFIENNYWKRITYTLWVSLCDCNSQNGLELIENSDKYGLQNVREKAAGIFGNRYYFQESIISKKVNKLNKTYFIPKAGGCIHFNSLVFHRTMINLSNEIRCSFEYRFTLKKAEYANLISNKILLKRFLLQNVPILFKLIFLPKILIQKILK